MVREALESLMKEIEDIIANQAIVLRNNKSEIARLEEENEVIADGLAGLRDECIEMGDSIMQFGYDISDIIGDEPNEIDFDDEPLEDLDDEPYEDEEVEDDEELEDDEDEEDDADEQ